MVPDMNCFDLWLEKKPVHKHPSDFMKSISRYIEEKRVNIDELISASGLDRKLVKAIIAGHYTPSPKERARLATFLGVGTDEISWGHSINVRHLRGNCPEWGQELA